MLAPEAVIVAPSADIVAPEADVVRHAIVAFDALPDEETEFAAAEASNEETEFAAADSFELVLMPCFCQGAIVVLARRYSDARSAQEASRRQLYSRFGLQNRVALR